MNESRSSEHGNALLFILLAVALLGFLTAVVSRSGSSVDQSGNVEQNRVKASALLRYSQSVAATVQKMLLNDGVSENDLDFVAIDASHDNTNCTEGYCEVFGVDGGGIAYRSASEVLNLPNFTENWVVSTGNRVYQMGCDTADTTCTEMLLLLKDIPLALCLQINRLADITNPSDDAPRQNGVIMGTGYTGTFTGTNPNYIGGTNAADESPEAKGKSAGCIYDFGTENTYIFYQILLAR